jgi:hypothetical protein
MAGRPDEAMAAATGLIDAAETTRNPYVLSYAHYTYGLAFRDADPLLALEARRRGLAIARESGNRVNETALLAGLSRIEAHYGDLTAAFDHVTVAIRNYHDSGNTTIMGTALALVAALFDRLERSEPAATIAGFAFSPLTAAAVPEITATSPTCARSSATRLTNRTPARARRCPPPQWRRMHTTKSTGPEQS